MREDDPDLDLVRALQAGQDQALAALMGRHREAIFRFAYRHLANEADAEEVAQETFVRAYFSIGRFRPTAKVSTWLCQIALNLCRDRKRGRAAQERAASVPMERVPEDKLQAGEASPMRPDQHLETRTWLAALEKAIAELPFKLRTPLILTALEGMSHQEAGRILGVSAKAVELRVYRARRLLSEKMASQGFLPSG
jgi:RNA polymerase sigma-70 factor (ECF subfamily)